jgi:hypothetical protein
MRSLSGSIACPVKAVGGSTRPGRVRLLVQMARRFRPVVSKGVELIDTVRKALDRRAGDDLIIIRRSE